LHRSTELKIPDNIRLVHLPPYSPELNPVEHIGDDLREKYFHNRVFDSMDSLENHLEEALRNLENNPNRVHSIVA
jgi:transposase